jgi:hypothetical protein
LVAVAVASSPAAVAVAVAVAVASCPAAAAVTVASSPAAAVASSPVVGRGNARVFAVASFRRALILTRRRRLESAVSASEEQRAKRYENAR